MISILFSSIFYYLLFSICILFYFRGISLTGFLIGCLSLIGMSFIASVNYELGILPQKFASQFSYDFFMGRESQLDNATFRLQAYLNSLAYLFTNRWESAIGVNVALIASLFLYTYHKDKYIAFWFFAPAFINFSMFALRDVLIAALFFLFILKLNKSKENISSSVILLFSTIFIFIRPEISALILLSYLTYYFINIKKIQLKLIIGLFGLVGFVVLGPYIPLLLGLKGSFSIFELAETMQIFYESRSNRWSGEDGGGSNILSGNLVNLPFYLRLPTQIISFFILPLPFEIRSLAMALSFIDSIFFISLYLKFRKNATLASKIFFWINVISISFFLSNYGNAFRLRMPMYSIMIAGILANNKLGGNNKNEYFKKI